MDIGNPNVEAVDPKEALAMSRSLKSQMEGIRKALETRRTEIKAELAEINAQLGKGPRKPRAPKAAPVAAPPLAKKKSA